MFKGAHRQKNLDSHGPLHLSLIRDIIHCQHDTLEFVNSLSSTADNGSSATVNISVIRNGNDPLSGRFKLAFDDGISLQTTNPINVFASSSEVKAELEALSNIVRVHVTHVEMSSGYKWNVEFYGCKSKGGVDVCNDGDLLVLVANNIDLAGCGSPIISVSQIVQGSGPGLCSNQDDGKCTETMSTNGNFPIIHELPDLSLGTKYYVQAMVRNSESLSTRQLSSPLF